RPIAIDPFNTDKTLYAGIHQCVLGQIGFRVDTRIHGVHIGQIPELTRPFGTAHAGDSLTGQGELKGKAPLGGTWHILGGRIARTERGAVADGKALALLDPGVPSGRVHALFETTDIPTASGLVWRVRDSENFWLLKLSDNGCFLVRVENGAEIAVAYDETHGIGQKMTHSVQILDA